MRAKHICMANGPLNKPQLPGVPGIETFKGHSFHTSRWDYDYTGGGPAEFFEILNDWRSVSYLPGLLLDGEPLEPTAQDKAYLRSEESVRARIHHAAKAVLDRADFMGVPKIGTVPVEAMRQYFSGAFDPVQRQSACAYCGPNSDLSIG